MVTTADHLFNLVFNMQATKPVSQPSLQIEQVASDSGPHILDYISALTPLFVAALLVLRLLLVWWRGWNFYVRKAVLLQALPGSTLRYQPENEFRFVCWLHSPDTDPEFFAHVAECYEVVKGDYAVMPAGVGERYWTYHIQRRSRMGWLPWLLRCCSLALTRRYKDPDLRNLFLC